MCASGSIPLCECMTVWLEAWWKISQEDIDCLANLSGFNENAEAKAVPSPACFSSRIKDAGIAICHLRGRILFYTAGFGNELKGVGIRWR